MKEYKITFWKVIKPSIGIICSLILFLCLIWGIILDSYYKGECVPNYIIEIALFFIFITFVPNLILGLNYCIEDRKKKLVVDSNKKIVIISKNKIEETFSFVDISKVIKVEVSSSRYKEFTTTAPWKFFIITK